MCGIGGVLWSPSARADTSAIASRMVEALRHRGPDACGYLEIPGGALVHTRLSILDLSSAGNQPFVDPEGRFTLVYNGEVYNYCELRHELEARGHRFRTATDTEVVLEAYRAWGPAALERFNGMWALAIWDAARGELFAARDRAGKKPLYYTQRPDGSWFFASEVKALLAAGLRFGYDRQAAADFLTLGAYGHLGARGFFDDVRQLPAGHHLTMVPGGSPRITRWWDLPVIPERERRPYDQPARDEFRAILEDAVRIRLRSDVPVGATLSGGLDSSTIVALMERHRGGAPLHLFTSLYPGSAHDETPYFDAVVARLAHPIVHRVTPPAGAWREALGDVLTHQEEPFGDTSILAHFHLMRAARAAGVPVILSGQGGDELLVGYPSMVNALLGRYLQRGAIGRALREARAWSASAGLPLQYAVLGALWHAVPLDAQRWLRARRRSRAAARLHPALLDALGHGEGDDEPARDGFARYVAQMFTRFAIPHLVHYDDRNAMAFAVEGRMPFLDHRLVELGQHLEPAAFFHDGRTKRILRDSCADLLPPLVRERRDKVGFHTPLDRWLREDLAWISDFMSEERLRHARVLAPDRYRARLRALAAGDGRVALEVWRGLVFHLWLDRFEVALP